MGVGEYLISSWWGRKSSEEEGKGKVKGKGKGEGKTLFSSPREGEGLIFFCRGMEKRKGKGRGKLDFLP